MRIDPIIAHNEGQASVLGSVFLQVTEIFVSTYKKLFVDDHLSEYNNQIYYLLGHSVVLIS